MSKPKSDMKKVFILAALIFSANSISAQDNNSQAEKEVTFFAGPSYSTIKNNNIEYDQYASTRGTIWFNIGLDYCKYTGKNLGYILGLEYSKYKNIASYKGAYRSETVSKDVFGDDYYKVSEANYTSSRVVNTVNVPLGLRLRAPISNDGIFFIDGGLILNFIASAKIIEKGNLNKKGAYQHPVYDNVYLYLEEDSYYGYTNAEYNSTIDIPINRVNISYFVGMGIKAKLKENISIVINPTYVGGINDIYKKEAATDYVNIFGEKRAHQKFTLSQFVLRVGIGFAI